MIKTNIKLRVTPKQSIAVQKICFSNNLYWIGSKDILDESAEYIFVRPQSLFLTRSQEYFDIYQLEEVDADLFIRTNGTCEELTCEHPGVNNTTGKCIACGENIDKSDFKSTEETTVEPECPFAKYGFEKPDFECEILKEYNDHLVGAVYQNEKYFGTSWNKQGACLQTKGFGYINMDLTPIKKPWYETCKFPCLVRDADNNLFAIIAKEEYSTPYDIEYLKTLTFLTNDEIEGLKQ